MAFTGCMEWMMMMVMMMSEVVALELLTVPSAWSHLLPIEE